MNSNGREYTLHPLITRMAEHQQELTPKSQIIGEYVLANSKKAIFMTVAELARACGVGEATVVRFVGQLGYHGYSEFQQSLRDFVNTELTLLDRVDMADTVAPGSERFRQVVFEEIDNLRRFYETIDLARVGKAVDLLQQSPHLYIVGSRLSYTIAYYLGWSLTKLRGGIQIFKGSDKTVIDWLSGAPSGSLVVIAAMSRYPNELLRLAKQVKRFELQLLVFTDSTACPLLQFADVSLVAVSPHIPLIGSPTTLACLINYIIQELAGRGGAEMKKHQKKLERSYWENDIFFNMKHPQPESNGY